MAELILSAQTILGNEKSMGLYEINEQAPDKSGFHRYQIIHVIRDGNIAEHRTDMGLVKGKWDIVGQFRIPGLLEETVDTLLDIADDIRNETLQDKTDILELVGALR
jgi:hypothetical protein